MSPNSPFRGAVFDMDGTLIASEALYREAWQRAAVEIGVVLEPRDYDRLMGLNRTDTTRQLHELFRSVLTAERFIASSEAHYDEIVAANGHTIRDGIQDLIDRLRSRGIALAVATSTHRSLAEETLEAVGLRHYFSVLATGDEVARGKPDPEIYLRATAQLNLPPASCVAFEDSVAGATSASTAGLTVVLIPELTFIADVKLPRLLRCAHHSEAMRLF